MHEDNVQDYKNDRQIKEAKGKLGIRTLSVLTIGKHIDWHWVGKALGSMGDVWRENSDEGVFGRADANATN